MGVAPASPRGSRIGWGNGPVGQYLADGLLRSDRRRRSEPHHRMLVPCHPRLPPPPPPPPPPRHPMGAPQPEPERPTVLTTEKEFPVRFDAESCPFRMQGMSASHPCFLAGLSCRSISPQVSAHRIAGPKHHGISFAFRTTNLVASLVMLLFFCFFLVGLGTFSHPAVAVQAK